MNGFPGGARIGNRRNKCTTCNNFAQNVRRITWTKLKEIYADEYRVLRLEAESELYPYVLQNFIEKYPESRVSTSNGRVAINDPAE